MSGGGKISEPKLKINESMSQSCISLSDDKSVSIHDQMKVLIEQKPAITHQMFEGTQVGQSQHALDLNLIIRPATERV